MGWHIRGIEEDALPHLGRVLLPILQRLARERPPEAGSVLLKLWHLVARGNDRVRSQHHPKVPATTHRRVRPPQVPGRPHARTEDRGRSSQLRGPDGPQQNLKQHRPYLHGSCQGRTAAHINEIETVPSLCFVLGRGSGRAIMLFRGGVPGPASWQHAPMSGVDVVPGLPPAGRVQAPSRV